MNKIILAALALSLASFGAAQAESNAMPGKSVAVATGPVVSGFAAPGSFTRQLQMSGGYDVGSRK